MSLAGHEGSLRRRDKSNQSRAHCALLAQLAQNPLAPRHRWATRKHLHNLHRYRQLLTLPFNRFYSVSRTRIRPHESVRSDRSVVTAMVMLAGMLNAQSRMFQEH